MIFSKKNFEVIEMQRFIRKSEECIKLTSAQVPNDEFL